MARFLAIREGHIGCKPELGTTMPMSLKSKEEQKDAFSTSDQEHQCETTRPRVGRVTASAQNIEKFDSSSNIGFD